MNPRISHLFSALQASRQCGFIVYITAGDPGMDDTVDIVLRLADKGVDLIELGIPFSDPLADGPVNQASAERALSAGVTLYTVLEGIRRIRAQSAIPLVLYSYLNPLLAHGFDKSLRQIARAGADGILVLDLSSEEAASYSPSFSKYLLDRICLVTPTSTDERIRHITEKANGFIYCVSREGVTGPRESLPRQAQPLLRRIRAHTNLPLALGFGISSAVQVREAARMADAVVVGSALVQRFHEAGRDGREEVICWAGELARAAHSSKEES